MAPTSRLGTGLLGTFGLALAGLMAYTLAFEGCEVSVPSQGRPAVSAEVSVFFPDRRDWFHFRHAVEACVRRGLARSVADDTEAVVVETPRLGRRVRFVWHGIRGVGETREEVARVARLRPTPVAVVGSSTTVLTAALAGPLRDAGPSSPVLLVPWATSVTAGFTDGGERLLEIDRGRTFRFCPDNRRLAGSVVDCLIDQDVRKPPGRIVLIVDPHDPYSVDLANSFRLAIESRVPAIVIDERRDALGAPSVSRSPGVVLAPSTEEEKRLADAIWTAADEGPADRTTWVVLPLQGDPARRMIAALQARSSWHDADEARGNGPLRVVCGDGVGRETLDGLAGHRAFPIWCASTSSARSPDHGVTDDTQTLAEIASAVLLAVEGSPRSEPTPDDVRDALVRLDLPVGDPASFGQPLAFGPNGERRNVAGHVLAVQPGSSVTTEYDRGADGRWRPAGSPGPTTAGASPRP